MKENTIAGGLTWKLLERFGVQGIQFILQLVLARIMEPEHYGALAMMLIFVNLASVFIQTGFNTSLIQNKEVTDEDYSSVFWVTFFVSCVVYGGLFFAAPWIASYYNMPEIVWPFRVLMLVLFPGSFNSVQLAKVSRALDFRKVFFSNIGGIVVSGVIGIVMAYMGAGVWALVVQNVFNMLIACIVMWFVVDWRPRLVCNLKRVKVLLSYGWKLLVSGLLDTLYQEVRSLVIGKKYNADTLGFYNRGKQFPQFVINGINGAVQSVMLPAMSAKQDNKSQVKQLMQNSIAMSAYLIFPVLMGLAGVAKPLVQVLLTDKWLPCVPYLQIYCFTLIFTPVHTCNLQAINAMGRSDLFLKLEIIKKAYGILLLVAAVVFFDSPIAIALSGVASTLLSCFVNAFPNKKLIGYSYFEQIKDLLPALSFSVVMLGVVLLVGLLPIPSILTLLLQVIGGVGIYIALSLIFRPKVVNLLFLMIKNRTNH
ncbi:MAG: lipopolysaccharide biosynthesis protein [Clostridia bacterium]|nr:lipopolysaccharide biosynthesis protein [Clostridia bacterium]